MNLSRRLILAGLSLLGALMLAGPLAAAPLAPPSATSATSAGAVAAAVTVQSSKHQHKWVKKPKKVKVPAKYKKVKVGTDKKGRPIYEKKLVKPAHYKTIYQTRCNICGRKK